MRKNHFYIQVALLLVAFFASSLPAFSQDGGGTWRRTIIVTTLDGVTMEYLLDVNTKVKIAKPNLLIETEGVVLDYDLEQMAQIRYGRRLIPSGIDDASADDGQPFRWEDETIFFDRLEDNTLIEVFTTDGKLVISRRCSGNTRLPLRFLSDGVYIVKINHTTYKIQKR